MKKDKGPEHRWHDMGGLEAGSINNDSHDFAIWEKRVDALLTLSTKKGLFTVDGLRRVLEDMGEDAFETGTGVHASAVIKAMKKGDKREADGKRVISHDGSRPNPIDRDRCPHSGARRKSVHCDPHYRSDERRKQPATHTR